MSTSDDRQARVRAWAVPFMYALLEYGKFRNERERNVCAHALALMEEGDWDTARDRVGSYAARHIDHCIDAANYVAYSAATPYTNPAHARDAVVCGRRAGVPKHILDALHAMYLAGLLRE